MMPLRPTLIDRSVEGRQAPRSMLCSLVVRLALAVGLIGCCRAGAQTRLFRFVPKKVKNWVSGLCAAGDLDRDGFPDLVVTGGPVVPGGPDKEGLIVLSGRDGRKLFSWSYRLPFGIADPTLIGDWDRDGVRDLAMYFHSYFSIGADEFLGIQVLSGKDGRILFRWPFPKSSWSYASR
ncbi:MAG: VCBS repeat-containing protein, partial [Caldilineae bacterium]